MQPLRELFLVIQMQIGELATAAAAADAARRRRGEGGMNLKLAEKT